MRIGKKDLILLGIQLIVWTAIILLPPLTAFLSTRGDLHATWITVKTVFSELHAPCILYFINFYLLIPYLFSKRRYWLFALVNIALINGLNLWMFRMPNWLPSLDTATAIHFFSGIFIYVLLNGAMIAAAVAIRHILKNRQLKRQLQEEKQKNTEAELAWLKNQINPHFLFNTLNNISSLTQIDADKAQDAIGQLSDLLRYAMYETNKTVVPLRGEIEFMGNYIELMKLRCNENTKVSFAVNTVNEEEKVAPLIFISLIENAFKHGVSSSRPSSIDIRLGQSEEGLTFTCENTNYPKSDKDRSGSGIGVENTKRRLELMYRNRYTWEQSIEENIYKVKITLTI